MSEWKPTYHPIGSKRRLQPQLRDKIVAKMHEMFGKDLDDAIGKGDALTVKAMAGKACSALKFRERTNNNDGVDVEAMQYTTYGSKGDPWCMDQEQTCIAIAEALTGKVSRYPMTASCADARQRMPKDMIIGKQDDAHQGDSLIYVHPGSGMGHVGSFWAWLKKFTQAFCTEGNTTGGKIGDKIVREGGGSYDTERALPGSDPFLKMIARPFPVLGAPAVEPEPLPEEEAPAQTDQKKKLLMYGDRGDEVKALQQALAAKGYQVGPIDGVFGKVTKSAVTLFQRDHGLVQDGIVGPVTRGALGGTVPVAPTPKPIPDVPGGSPLNRALSWEKNHPERAAWSKFVFAYLKEHWETFQKVTDLGIFHSNTNALTVDQKILLLAEIICWTCYYECGWNPASASVDVGTAGDKDTWSVGLMQMSVVDQKNYGLKLGYDYEDLKDPIKNLTLALAILGKQIEKQKKLVVATGVYWSTLRDPSLGRSTKVPQIAANTAKLQL